MQLGSSLVLAGTVFMTVAARADLPEKVWPQWRGPNGLGISTERNLPLQWSATNGVLWKTPLPGHGLSSPVVWGDRVFLTTAQEGEPVPGAKATKHVLNGEDFKHPESVGADRKQALKVICLNAKTGGIQWEKVAYEGTVFDDRHRAGSFAAPTPVTDGKAVYAFFGGEGLYAYDLEGNLKWKQALGGLATLGLGPGTSPVLWEDAVIVQCDQDNGESSFIAAFNRNDGKQLWRVDRKVSVSWATPILVKSGNGRAELVTSGMQSIIAYDPATGRELWRCEGLAANAVPSPVAGQGLVFLATGYPTKKTVAIRPGGNGDITGSTNVVWEFKKGTGYVPSPIAYGDYLYLVTDSGILTCLDAKTGAVEYEGGRLPEPARLMTSPVAYQGHLFLTSEKGDTFVIKAGPKHEVIGKNTLGEPAAGSIAIADGKLYLRGEKHLFCIGNL